MPSRTFIARVDDKGSTTTIAFYKEMPGGWKLDFRDGQGNHIANGNRWAETLDDLVLQLADFTKEDLHWRAEDNEPISFYAAVQECILSSSSH
ncbi:hypothetical protein [Qipengyuania sp.]|uniref:hypothetical protein n=1 Tax=Qipengyuania sp. TaxID=2004515 RepID=UPI003513ACDA